MSKNILLKYIRSLLDDVSIKLGKRIIAPDDIDIQWFLIEGPRLDKLLLGHFEQWVFPQQEGYVITEAQAKAEAEMLEYYPEWLLPLAEIAIENHDPEAVRWLRQVLCFVYKARYEPTIDQLSAAQAAFEETDRNCSSFDEAFRASPKSLLVREARKIISRVVSKCNWLDTVPSHGPGAVYPRSVPSMKGQFPNIPSHVLDVYPLYDHFNCLPNFWRYGLSGSLEVASENLAHARLTAVPKDSRGPRLICVHNGALVWIQQAQRRILERAIANSAASRFITLDDQSGNALRALQSSKTRELATLDLSEASDRLSEGLVEYLFGAHYKYLAASRAQTCELMDGRVIRLSKYAPMGNANVFPVESLCFWALAVASIRLRRGSNAVSDVYVYGDDIECPNEYAGDVCAALSSVGLKVNLAKSFARGFFRESCGMDAFNGICVTPHRLKRWDLVSYSDLSSLCALAKNLRIDGWEETAACIYSSIRKQLRKLPLSNNRHAQGIYEYVQHDIGFLIANEPDLVWNKNLHRFEVPVLQPRPVLDRPSEHAWWHVQESLLSLIARYGKEAVTDTGRGNWNPHAASVSAGPRKEAGPRLGLACTFDPSTEYWNMYTLDGVRHEYAFPRRERFVRGWVQCYYDCTCQLIRLTTEVGS